MLNDFLKYIANFIKDKKAIIQKIALFLSSKNTLKESKILIGIAYFVITQKYIYNTLIIQSIWKIPVQNRSILKFYI